MSATPPPFDTRPTIRLDHTMPENPKIVGLTDAAFRLFIECLCWCSRQESDGVIPKPAMKRLGRPRVVAELVATGLIHDLGDTFEVHDYLAHQRSSAEIAAFRAGKRESGQKGAHMRWHVPRRVVDKDCPFCQEVNPGA